ncbi:WYL domain-containing protein [Planococcus sp. APC 4015]|nr:WYL domain-containing protein [Planococcus sp. APC 4015]
MTSPTSRLLRLLSLLQARRDWPGDVLAERLDVSARTVRRDVEHLREMGYRVTAVKGPDGGYRLDAGSELPPLLFDDGQVVALAVALRTASASGVDIAEDAERALATVRQVLPQRLRHRLDALTVTGAVDPQPVVDPTVLLAVSAAVRATEVLRFGYTSGGGLTTRRRVEPHHIVASGGRWYLVAWDLDVDDWRIHRVDRMAPVTPTGPRFRRRDLPQADVATFVAARFKGSSHENRWPCEGRVVLTASAAEIAPYIGEAEVIDRGDGTSELRAGSWSWESLAASLMRFGVEIEAAQPPDLADAFITVGRRMLAAGVPG